MAKSVRTKARKEAMSLGLKFYATGRPCHRGHIGERYTSTGRCLQCEVKKTARRRGVSTKTPQKVCAWARGYYARNRDERRAYYKRWTANNPEKARAGWRNSKARRKGALGIHNANDISEILALQKHRGAYCRADLRKVKTHIDHIEPIRRGGSNNRSNIQMLCAPCNLSKNARHPIEFAQSIGLLL